MAPYLTEFTKKIAPFGCRSRYTERLLNARKIKNYFSACLTLTTDMQGAILHGKHVSKTGGGMKKFIESDLLKPDTTTLSTETKKKTKIVLIDVVDPEAIPETVRQSEDTIYLGANLYESYPSCETKLGRYGYSYKLLSTYANQAKVVVTSRIHAGLPAAALGVPVIFVENAAGKREGWLPGGKQSVGRVEGLLDIFHRVQRGVEGKEWAFGNLTGTLPSNEGVHLADRYRASFWNVLKKTSFYHDSATMFGMIPFQRLGRNNIEIGTHDRFHVVLEDLTWQTKRVIEHILYFHPNARVFVHTNGIFSEDLEIFKETGYDVVAQPYDLDSLLKERFVLNEGQLSARKVALPFLLLNKYGGVFVSENTMILKKMTKDGVEGAVFQENGQVSLAYFDQGSNAALNHVNNVVDSSATGSAFKMNGDLLWTFPVLSKQQTVECATNVTWKVPGGSGYESGLEGKIALNLHPDFQKTTMDTILMDSECYRAVEKLCIFCDEIHWDFVTSE